METTMNGFRGAHAPSRVISDALVADLPKVGSARALNPARGGACAPQIRKMPNRVNMGSAQGAVGSDIQGVIGFAVLAGASRRASLSRRQKSFLLVTCFVPSLLARLARDLYSTSSRSSRTMRM